VKTARVRVQIHRTYLINVDAPDDATRRGAESAAHDLGSLVIHEEGKLENVEVDWPEFEGWIPEEYEYENS